MSTYTPEKLVALWAQQQIDLEQLAGYMLQIIVEMDKQIKALKAGSPPSSASTPPRSGRPKPIRPN